MSTPNDMRVNCLTRVASVSVNLNGTAADETALYTVPAGHTFIPAMVILRDLSASATSAVITLGKAAGNCDEFLGDQTLSALDGTTKVGILQPIPHGTTADGIEFTAGQIFAMEITTAAGIACTAVADVFGYLY
jgi:hypothetical protein